MIYDKDYEAVAVRRLPLAMFVVVIGNTSERCTVKSKRVVLRQCSLIWRSWT